MLLRECPWQEKHLRFLANFGMITIYPSGCKQRRESTFVKIAGIILIVLQVLALLGGSPTPPNPNFALSYYLGYCSPGIIGVILLLIGIKRAKAKKDADNE